MVGLGPKLTLSTCAAQQIQITSTSRFWSTKILLSIGPFDLVFLKKKMGVGTSNMAEGFCEVHVPFWGGGLNIIFMDLTKFHVYIFSI